MYQYRRLSWPKYFPQTILKINTIFYDNSTSSKMKMRFRGVADELDPYDHSIYGACKNNQKNYFLGLYYLGFPNGENVQIL